MNEMPKDPVICLSYINTQLRDYYSDLDELCQDKEFDKSILTKRMEEIGYYYRQELNQFK